MHGKTVVITGATSGHRPGRRPGELARMGARVVFTARGTPAKGRRRSGERLKDREPDRRTRPGARRPVADRGHEVRPAPRWQGMRSGNRRPDQQRRRGVRQARGHRRRAGAHLRRQPPGLFRGDRGAAGPEPCRRWRASSAPRPSPTPSAGWTSRTSNRPRHYRRAGMEAYGTSKLMNILWTRELARRLAGTGIDRQLPPPRRGEHRLRRQRLRGAGRPVHSSASASC